MSTIEEELLQLRKRWLAGDKLPVNSQLHLAAQKTRDGQAARVRVADMGNVRPEPQTVPVIQSVEDEVPEQKETERIAAESRDRESIRFSLNIPPPQQGFEAGQQGTIPFELINLGREAAEFLFETTAPPQFAATVRTADRKEQQLTRIKLAADAQFKGVVSFSMPPEKIDGFRNRITLKAVSGRFSDISQTVQTEAITAAPMIRVVGKPMKGRLTPGEESRYRITILNLGSVAARTLNVRLHLPKQIEFLGAPGTSARKEADGAIVFPLEALEPGKLAELGMEIRIRPDSNAGEELRSIIEVENRQQQMKQSFTSAAVVIQAP